MNPQDISAPPDSPAGSFAERIKLLIRRVGSATEIARMCGFSEGVVRSWRDGNTDPSRARCVTLARTLGISLVWLVAGEGSPQFDVGAASPAEQHRSSLSRSQNPVTTSMQAEGASSEPSVDSKRLNTAMRILQSELSLAGSTLSLPESADLLTELYGILSPDGAHVDPIAMVTFNHRLAQRIRQNGTVA